jgi:hypothetical protein
MNLQTEYELDFYGWINHNLALLKQGRLQDVDLDHLIEELEYMATQDKNTLASRFIILIAHLLKWQFQLKQLTERWENYNGSSWRGSINEQRTKISFHLENSPSLKKHLKEAVEKAYPKAVSLAIKETKLSPKVFPKTCPYSVEQLLSEDFYPIPE